MAKSTIRLPAATPHAYLAWVTWWKDVEALIGSDFSGQGVSSRPKEDALSDTRSRGIVDEHLLVIEEQAKMAIESGRDEIAPELRAELDQWNEWLDYGRTRREWLEALALKKLPDRALRDDLETLWRDTMRVIQAVVSDHLVLHNVRLIPEDEPGRFLLRGELEVTNIEAVAQRLEAELQAGHRLRLDLSGVKFIDSQGVALLIRLSRLAGELGLAPVTVFAPSKEVSTVLAIALPQGLPDLEVRGSE
jgi:anti-anti-sigma factor